MDGTREEWKKRGMEIGRRKGGGREGGRDEEEGGKTEREYF